MIDALAFLPNWWLFLVLLTFTLLTSVFNEDPDQYLLLGLSIVVSYLTMILIVLRLLL